MSKRRYTFGLAYVGKLKIQYSLIYGWYVKDHYSTWLVNMEPKDTSEHA